LRKHTQKKSVKASARRKVVKISAKGIPLPRHVVDALKNLELPKVSAYLSVVLRERTRDASELREAKKFLADRWADVGIDEMEMWGSAKRAPGRPKGVLQLETLKRIAAIAENDAKPSNERVSDRSLYSNLGLTYEAGRVFRTNHMVQIAAATARLHGKQPTL
jgi:hypothetical protein